MVNESTLKYTDINRTFYNHSVEGLFIINSESKIVLSNAASALILGYRVGQLETRFLKDLVSPEFEEECRILRANCLKGKVISPEKKPIIKLIRLNGELIFAELNTILRTETSEGPGILLMFSDITKRYLYNENLKQITELYENTLDVMGEAFVNLDKNWRFTYLNNTAIQVLNRYRSKKDYVGQEFWEVFPEAIGTIIESMYKEVMEKKEPIIFEVPLPMRGLWLEHRVCAIGNGIAIFVRDITAEKKKEVEIAKSDERFEKAFLSSPVALAMLNFREGKFLEVNPRFLDLFGFRNEEIIGNTWSTFLSFEKDERYQWKKITDLLKQKNNIRDIEIRAKRKSGVPVNARFSFEILELHEKEVVLVTIIDITEERKAQEAVIRINEFLENTVRDKTRELTIALEKERENNEMKSRFVSLASHEFRTPLTGLLTSVSILEMYTESQKNENITKHFSRIKLSVSQLTEILNDFLSIDKLEHGKIKSAGSSFDLKDIAETVIEEIGGILKLGQFIRYEHQGDSDVYQDRAIIQNSLLNLLSNASKYSQDHKRIDFIVEVGKLSVTVKVRDQGIGIPLADQANIFTSFFRAKNTETIQGTGLGLNIVKKYMDLIGGTLNFSSIEHEGSEFVITFPRNVRVD
ncbi:MAG: PAS domain S-box protein [bacterium]|nr:PAS domain S-box protein [bacterium]